MPQVEHVYDLSDNEKLCGCMMSQIGERVSEQLDIEPATVQVIRYIRYKYACKCCEDTVKLVEAPKVLPPKAIASANTLAYLVTTKYADGLPLYRLSGILKRYGVSLPRQTLSEPVLMVVK